MSEYTQEPLTPSEPDTKSAIVKPLVDSVGALPALADTSLKAPVALRIMPLLYAGVPTLVLLQALYSGIRLMKLSFGTGLWTIVYGVLAAFVLLLGLRVSLECAAKYLRS